MALFEDDAVDGDKRMKRASVQAGLREAEMSNELMPPERASERCMSGSAVERMTWIGEILGEATPSAIFDKLLRQLHLSPTEANEFTVIGRPDEVLDDLAEGDLILTRALGEGPIAHVDLMLEAKSGDVLSAPEAGRYAQELGPGRRLAPNQMVIRPTRCRCQSCRAY